MDYSLKNVAHFFRPQIIATLLMPDWFIGIKISDGHHQKEINFLPFSFIAQPHYRFSKVFMRAFGTNLSSWHMKCNLIFFATWFFYYYLPDWLVFIFFCPKNQTFVQYFNLIFIFVKMYSIQQFFNIILISLWYPKMV